MQDLFDFFESPVAGHNIAKEGIRLCRSSVRVGFGDVIGGQGRKVVGRDVDGLGVLGCIMECVSEVVQEGVAFPAEPDLDVRVRHALSVEEITCCNSWNGVTKR